MPRKQSILKKLYEQDLINNEKDIVIGIAKAAIDNGYDSLSDKQKNVINHLFDQECVGVTNPGGHFNNCKAILTEEELDNALELSMSYDGLLCFSCIDETEEYRRHWDRISKE